MVESIGTEFIRIVPDASGFRAEVQAQIAGALPAVQSQVAAAQRQASRATSQVGNVLLPPGVRSVSPELERAAAATQSLGAASRKAATDTAKLTAGNRGVTNSGAALSRSIQTAERDVGRYTRGVAAATLASTGFFRAVSFASGAFLLGAAVGGTIGAAVAEFKNMTVVGAQTAAVIKATGGAANVTAKQIDELSKKTLALTGIDDEQVKSAANILLTFRNIRNETGRMNDVFTRATRDVVDISSVFKTDLRGSAVQLGKALQDPVKGVTALRRSGITLSEAQRKLIKSLVDSGRILTAQKLILSEVEKQVGGTAEAIGRTLPGRLAILRESAKNSLGEFVKRLSESRQAVQIFDSATTGLGQAFKTTVAIFATSARVIAAPFKVLNDTFPQLAQALSVVSARVGGLKELVKVATTAALVFGTLKVATLVASLAQSVYARATTVSAVATAAETRALIAAAAAQAALAEGATVASIALAAENAAAGAATARIGLGEAALAALRGPLGIAVGVTALAVGFIKLRQAAANAPGTLDSMRKSLDALNDSVARAASLRTSLAGAGENVSIARFDVNAANRTLARRQAALAQSGAAPGSLESVHLTQQVTEAETALAAANRAVFRAEQQRDTISERLRLNEAARGAVIASTTKKFQQQIIAMREGSSVITIFGHRIRDMSTDLLGLSQHAQGSLGDFQKRMQDLAKSGAPLQKNVAGALDAISIVLNKIPTAKQVKIIVRAIGQGMTTNQALALLGIGADSVRGGTEQTRLRGLATTPSESVQAEQEFLAQKAILDTLRKKEKVARKALQAQKETTQSARDERDNARDALTSAVDSLANARQTVTDSITALSDAVATAHRNIADAIKAAKQATNDAITSAKTNLDSLGQSLADLLNNANKELGARGNGKLSPAFERLRAQILAGGGGPETQLAAQRIQARLAAPKVDTDKIAKAFALLTDNLNTNRISLRQFGTGVRNLLKGVDLNALRRIDPLLARQIQRVTGAIGQQSGNITRGPRRTGSGQDPTVVNIAATIRAGAKSIVDARTQAARDIKDANRAIKDATKSVSTAEHDVARAQHRLAEATDKLRRDQTRETRLNTKFIRLNTAAIQQNNKLLGRGGGNSQKPKPKGDAASRAADLANHGALTP